MYEILKTVTLTVYQVCFADHIYNQQNKLDKLLYVVQSSFMHPKFLKKSLPSTALKSKFQLFFFSSVNSETGGAFQSTNWKAQLSEEISLHTPTCNDYPWSLVWPGGPQTTLPIARKPQKYRWSLPKTSIVVEVRLGFTCGEKKLSLDSYMYILYTILPSTCARQGQFGEMQVDVYNGILEGSIVWLVVWRSLQSLS